jgi:hypothetical protein
VKKEKKIGLDFEVDKLTNSIENVITGDSFATDISIVTKNDLKEVTKKNKWVFKWRDEYKQPERDVYKLTIINNQKIIQGLELNPSDTVLEIGAGRGELTGFISHKVKISSEPNLNKRSLCVNTKRFIFFSKIKSTKVRNPFLR